ncbi:MAG: amidohydrolase family protein [Actinobacteria bacterium]|nr:amidohydrolase family protein [Actinomycetota bacterium]
MFENINFDIIDIHSHFGPCTVFDVNVNEQELINALDKYNVKKAVVQLFPGVAEYNKYNNKLIEFIEKYNDRLFGLISINPHISEKDFNNEVDRLMKTELFKAIKMHTIGHAVNPLLNDADKICRAASKYDIPVMVHTGPGIPFALPSMIRPVAKKYKNINFILAHAGGGQIYSPDAVFVSSDFDNVFLETSWTTIDDKRWFLNALGAEKIIFGSDMPYNLPVELYQYKLLDIKEKDIRKILNENAARLLKIKI